MTKPTWKLTLLKYILLVGSVTLAIFTFYYLLNEIYILSIIEGVSSIFLVLAIILVNKGKYLEPALIGWFGIFVVLLTILISGGIAGAGLVWWTLIPIISFMMFGLMGGVFAVFVGTSTLITTAFLKYYNLVPIYFEVGRLIQTSVALTVIGVIMYYFEKIENSAREEAINKTNLLLKAQTEVNKNLEQLEEEKNNQIKIKKAMLNLLEDSRELEEKLNKEKEKADAIISSMGEGLFVLNSKHQIELINPVAEKLLGVNKSDILGKDWTEVAVTLKGDTPISLSDRSTMRALKAGKSVTTNIEDDHYYLTNSGKKFPVISITTPLMEDGEVVGVIKVFKDVTYDKHSKELIEEKVTERTLELEREKAKLSASIENMPVGFMLTDILGNVLITNGLAYKNLGAKDDKDAYSIVKRVLEGKVDLTKYLHECNENTKTLVYRDINLPDGRFIKLFLSPILSEDNNKKKICSGMVVLIDDITEVRIAERSRDEFFSIASHELRTPLTTIRGNTSLIQDMYADKIKDPDMKEMISDIHESSVRLIGIVNDFLNVSRLEMGKIIYKKESFDIVDLASAVVNELGVPKSTVKLQLIKPANKLPKVFGDCDRTKEIIINLISNGIKYTEKGEVEISFEIENKFVKVRVRDTGRGISLENQKLLFHKFQQAGSSLLTRDTTKSTGLGLYISKLLVEGMGGKIGIDNSEVGVGSVFSFSLPIVV